MSKMTQEVKAQREANVTKKVENFMGGYSYELNPIDTLKMVSASSIFGEPAYYRNGAFSDMKIKDGLYEVDKAIVDDVILSLDKFGGMSTSELMEKIIDEALVFDYKAVLEWAIKLRKEYLMRLNPQVIMVRAAMSNCRKAFTKENPGEFARINNIVMQRADDVIAQFTYFLFKNGDKKSLPNILKKSWAKKIESLSRYELYKYRNHGIGLVDTIRVCHANNKDVDELMTTGTIVMPEENATWETLRANGKSWTEILNTLGKMNHMAALRNLRGVFSEIDDYDKTLDYMNDLVAGVENGKQFPFRYMSAKNALNDSVHNKILISDKLEECLDAACKNLPHFKGRNAFLSDNSGSAWGTCNSEYGTTTIAEIDNLSSVIGAANSDEGIVVEFGDKMIKHEISKRDGILGQAKKISDSHGHNVGASTENGVWLFFEEALEKNIHYDNIFIYSDMQAGHGGLYGTKECSSKYSKLGFSYKNGNSSFSTYIDVAKLIKEYRSKVNPKVNVYCVQTAGYNNILVPENSYRTNILYGWTGKELVYAKMMNDFWDELDSRKNK